jgi:RNA polymerase subunit RPABC4/transcription elongation factor Spt4
MGCPRRLRRFRQVTDSQSHYLCPYCMLLRAASEWMKLVLCTDTQHQVGSPRTKIEVLGPVQ